MRFSCDSGRRRAHEESQKKNLEHRVPVGSAGRGCRFRAFQTEACRCSQSVATKAQVGARAFRKKVQEIKRIGARGVHTLLFRPDALDLRGVSKNAQKKF